MDERLNLGSKVKELKLGSTFSNSNSRSATSFHTLKYDFKPASVDLSKVATLDVSSNNQVTVTVPHLDSSGVPKTVFKGNQRNYTKECVLIIDKVTGEITLEKLSHNIQVKKTRSENTHKPMQSQPPRAALENSTQRTVSKTKVSTGIRKNALAGIVQRNSPIQGSPSYQHHKSPQQAPAWNANNNQSTLPSIPIIGMDDDVPEPQSYNQQQQQQPQHQHQPHHQQQSQQQQHYQQQQQQSHHNSIHSFGHNMNMPMSSGVSSNHQHSGNSGNVSNNHHHHHHHHSSSTSSHMHNNPQQQHSQQQHLGNDMALLSSSDSSSDSDSSGSGSDSDDTSKPALKNHLNNHHNNRSMDHNALLLDEDLRLSESNSSDSDD